MKLLNLKLERKSNCSFTYLLDGETLQSSVSLQELRNSAVRLARHLPRQVPVLLLPQGISFITAFFGCLYAQSVAIPIAVPGKKPGLGKVRSIVADAGVAHAITNWDTLNYLSKWFGEDELISRIHWFLVEDIERETDDSFPLPEMPKPDQITLLQYTSGSTGSPKGVMITHENIIANSQILQTFFKNSTDSISVCWLPSLDSWKHFLN